LHCEKCGNLIEFHSDEVAAIRDAVAREYGFRVSSHRLIIEGVCKDCQMVTRKRPRRLDRI
jgi:Fur family ferric uptake transcriptional regulator